MTAARFIARFLLDVLCVVTLAGSAYAQTAVGPIPPDASARQYHAPLQQNLNSVTAPAVADSQSFEQRCKKFRSAYDDSYRSSTPDQVAAPGLLGAYDSGGNELSMRAYNQRDEAVKAYRDAGCR